MTEKEVYKNGVALLEEWEDVNYCEHSFKFKDEWLTDKEVVDKLNELAEEKDYFERKKEYFLSKWSIANAENIQLRQENKELQERNDSQAKQLGNIYHLIEKQDWKALKGIIDEFKECEEQLQKEWRTYGDVE